MVMVEVQEPEMVLMATLTGLEPATTYSISVTAYTTAGGGTGPAIAIATLESGEPPFHTLYIGYCMSMCTVESLVNMIGQ